MHRTKKKSLVWLLQVSLILTLLFTPSLPALATDESESKTDPSLTLEDIEGHLHESGIIRAAELGLMHGDEQGMFHPDQAMTRGDFLNYFYRLILLHPSIVDEYAFDSIALIQDRRFHHAKLPYKDVKVGNDHFSILYKIHETIDALQGKGSFHRIFTGDQFQADKHISLAEVYGLLNAFFFHTVESDTGATQSNVDRLSYFNIISQNEKEDLFAEVTRGAGAALLSRTSEVLSAYTLLPTLSGSSNYFTYDFELDLSNPLLFDVYDENSLTEQDKQFLQMIDEILNDEADSTTLKHLRDLKNSGYRNQAGVLFYIAYLDDTLGVAEKNQLLTQALSQLLNQNKGSVEEFYSLLSWMSENIAYANYYGHSIEIRTAVEDAMRRIPQDAIDKKRLLTAYLAFDDQKKGNASAAIMKYKQVIDLKESQWAYMQLSQSYVAANQYEQAIMAFKTYLNQAGQNTAKATFVPALKVILSDFASMKYQEEAANLLDKAYNNVYEQDGMKLSHLMLEDQWFGTFDQTTNFKNGVTYFSGQYYTGASLTPKKYEEYSKVNLQNGSRITYYYTSDIKEWLYSDEPQPMSLTAAIGQSTFQERVKGWKARYILHETETDYIIFESIPEDILLTKFGGETFSDGKLVFVDRFTNRYVIDKKTLLPKKESWNYSVQYDSSLYPKNQFGSTVFNQFGANDQSVPVSVLQKAKKENE
jgi:hypothetical protein